MLNHRNAHVNLRNCHLCGGGSAMRAPMAQPTSPRSTCGCGCGDTGNANGNTNGNGNGNGHGQNHGHGHAPMPIPNGGCGCGCGQHPHTDCQKLMQQIRAVDFALYEVVLYLDVYPESCEALNTYHKLVARQKALYEQYQASCGPITASGNASTTAWNWTDGPFPWEASANG